MHIYSPLLSLVLLLSFPLTAMLTPLIKVKLGEWDNQTSGPLEFYEVKEPAFILPFKDAPIVKLASGKTDLNKELTWDKMEGATVTKSWAITSSANPKTNYSGYLFLTLAQFAKSAHIEKNYFYVKLEKDSSDKAKVFEWDNDAAPQILDVTINGLVTEDIKKLEIAVGYQTE